MNNTELKGKEIFNTMMNFKSNHDKEGFDRYFDELLTTDLMCVATYLRNLVRHLDMLIDLRCL